MRSQEITKLQKLERLQKGVQDVWNNWDEVDSVEHLSQERQRAWKKLLTSVAATESSELVLMGALLDGFKHQPEIQSYFVSHQMDERRHHRHLNQYVLKTFGYFKRKSTLSDKVVYETLFPKIAHLCAKSPGYGIALLLFFESFGVTFYHLCRAQAENDHLEKLVQLIDQIEKDEKRHLAGLKILLQASMYSEWTALDLVTLDSLLAMVVLDVNFSWWAIHNRAVRRNALEVGLNPTELSQAAFSAAAQVHRQIKTEMRRGRLWH